MSLRRDLAALAERLCPESCPRCGLESGRGFCRACLADFRRIEAPCRGCGLPTPCRSCAASGFGWRLAAVRAPFVYAPPLAQFLQALKYARARHLGAALGLMLADALAGAEIPCDAMVAVPLHRKRLAERRFNQADEIARPLARRLRCRVIVARRLRDTPPQATLDRPARLAGPAGAFAVDVGLSGLRIAIVDDVITTGATVNALAGSLIAAGAVAVEAVAVARALGHDRKAAEPRAIGRPRAAAQSRRNR